MKNIKKLYALNISIIDVAFGILLGILFERYSKISSTASRLLFFLTIAIIINYYYTYRKWVEKIGQIVKKTILLDIITDLGMVFFGYQLVYTFNNSKPDDYYIWFMTLYLMDTIWILERVFVHHVSRFQINLFKFWILTDLFVFIILFILRNRFLRLHQFFPIGLMIFTFVITFCMDPFYESLIKKLLNRKKKEKLTVD